MKYKCRPTTLIHFKCLELEDFLNVFERCSPRLHLFGENTVNGNIAKYSYFN